MSIFLCLSFDDIRLPIAILLNSLLPNAMNLEFKVGIELIVGEYFLGSILETLLMIPIIYII
jgi:hypothetical protein